MPNPAQVGAADPLSSTIMLINTNPYIIGLFMLLLNLGGRFLVLEPTKKQEEFLQSPWLRPLLFFTVIFIATRNLAAAFYVTILFFLIVWVVANEKSPYCMIPSWCGHNVETAKTKGINEATNRRTFRIKIARLVTVPKDEINRKYLLGMCCTLSRCS
jgi:ABC-type uncharacterized transport system permease subunit